MDKIQALNLVDDLRTFHESQMYKVGLLLSEKDIEEMTSLSKTECDFGKSLHANENKLREIIGSIFYEKLDSIHEKWHTEYYSIYKIFAHNIDKKKKGILSKLIGGKRISKMDIDKAKFYYSELKLTTKELLSTIEICRRRVAALSESKFR